ncbi:hypothetical protein [Aquisphaera insulae]|uniref:hypothetical protein n=1 Tax=Aquisphaera insulae TaxID=2712864 RepID=UPI0013ED1948|nr:hypothetical protein [Aquisphaera insulae]
MNQIIDRRRFFQVGGLLAVGGLVAGCGNDTSSAKNIVLDKPPLEASKDSMEEFKRHQPAKKKASKKH